jgi:hypothetical protein
MSSCSAVCPARPLLLSLSAASPKLSSKHDAPPSSYLLTCGVSRARLLAGRLMLPNPSQSQSSGSNWRQLSCPGCHAGQLASRTAASCSPASAWPAAPAAAVTSSVSSSRPQSLPACTSVKASPVSFAAMSCRSPCCWLCLACLGCCRCCCSRLCLTVALCCCCWGLWGSNSACLDRLVC